MKTTVISALLVMSNITVAGHFVGFTTNTVTGNVGVLGMNQACASEFLGTKFCSSKDIVLSPSLVAATGDAWVRPEFIDYEAGNALDYSGVSGPVDDFSCKGWTDGSASNKGLYVKGDTFGFEIFYFCSSEISVSCCNSSAAYRIAPN